MFCLAEFSYAHVERISAAGSVSSKSREKSSSPVFLSFHHQEIIRTFRWIFRGSRGEGGPTQTLTRKHKPIPSLFNNVRKFLKVKMWAVVPTLGKLVFPAGYDAAVRQVRQQANSRLIQRHLKLARNKNPDAASPSRRTVQIGNTIQPSEEGTARPRVGWNFSSSQDLDFTPLSLAEEHPRLFSTVNSLGNCSLSSFHNTSLHLAPRMTLAPFLRGM